MFPGRAGSRHRGAWVLFGSWGKGPGAGARGGASLAGEGAGSPAQREVRGSAWSAGPARPGAAPFCALSAPSPSGIPPRPSTQLSRPHPHSGGLTSDPCSRPPRPPSAVSLHRPIPSLHTPPCPGPAGSFRVEGREVTSLSQVGLDQPLFEGYSQHPVFTPPPTRVACSGTPVLTGLEKGGNRPVR